MNLRPFVIYASQETVRWKRFDKVVIHERVSTKRPCSAGTSKPSELNRTMNFQQILHKNFVFIPKTNFDLANVINAKRCLSTDFGVPVFDMADL